MPLRCRLVIVFALFAVSGCGGGSGGTDGGRASPAQLQADADLLGRELFEVVDRVMAYRTSHLGRVPPSLRIAGLDSLTPLFIRRLDRIGADPLVTVVFRRTEDHGLRSCQGTNLVLEEAVVNGAWEVVCTLAEGGSRTFTVRKPPPKKDRD